MAGGAAAMLAVGAAAALILRRRRRQVVNENQRDAEQELEDLANLANYAKMEVNSPAA